MKKYTFEVIIHEGNDEDWDELREKGVTGCDEISQTVHDALYNYGLPESKVKLVEYTDK